MSYQKSTDKKIQKLSNLLTKYAETQGLEFCFGGEEVYAMETFAHFGGLVLFLAEAKDSYEKIYNKLYTVEELMSEITKGKKIKKLSLEESMKEQDYLNNQPRTKLFPIDFIENSSETYFGFTPTCSDDIPADFFMLSHVAIYTLDEYIKIYKKNKMLLVEGKIPLDPLYEKMMNKVNSRMIQIKTPSASKDAQIGVSFSSDMGNI